MTQIQSTQADGSNSVPTPASAKGFAVRVEVDPRVELVSLIFRLAGNPEYNRGRVASYSAEADEHFGKFHEHPAVQLARQGRDNRGVSYDACMSLAVMLTDAREPALRLPLSPWPESLDSRWTPSSANSFVTAARQFVKDSAFAEFVAQHQSLYETTTTRLRDLMAKEAHMDWFGGFFGERAQASFTVVPALFNGGCCYGPHFRGPAGKEELFCILGVWETDGHGLPSFRRNMLDTVVHEFCHSYANPVIDRHAASLEPAGKKLFAEVKDAMSRQAYGDARTMLRESLVRACVVRYVRHVDGAAAAEREIKAQKQRSFLWIGELSELLGEYESQREKYPTLDSFAPRLASFFKDYAAGFTKKQAALKANRPNVN